MRRINWNELNCKRIESRIGNVTKCQNWSSWLYSLVSNLQLFSIYAIMWLETASLIYIYSLSSKLYQFYRLFHDFIFFYLIPRCFFYYSSYGLTTLRSHFCLEGIMLHSYWLIKSAMDGVAVCHIFILLKPSSAR